MSTTLKIGTLYMNNVPVLFNTLTPIQYINNATLELKPSIADNNYNIEWVSFNDGAKQFLLSTRNILSNISYTSLLQQTLVVGNTLVTLNGTKYKVRLLTNEEYNRYILNSIGLTSLLTPTTQDETLGAYTDGTISTSDSNNLWHWWKSATLTKTFSDANNLAIRGGDTVNKTSTLDKNSMGNWRILLEKYNYPPVISGYDTSLGSCTTNIVQKYTVTDADLDLFKVQEYLDGNIIRTLENQSSNTEFTLTLINQWTSLSAGSHTILIKVIDITDNEVERKFTFNKIVDTTTGTSPNLTRPIIITPDNSLSLLPINAKEDNKIKFNVVGGELFYAHEINIIDNTNSSITIYNKKTEDFEYYDMIPKNVLINGNTYQIKLRTYNSVGQYSSWSDTVLVKCLTPVDLMITTIIDGKIENPNPVMIGTYHQAESDVLYSYKYILYKDGVQVDYSDESKDGRLTHQFTNLENKTNYTIELIVLTSSGMTCFVKQDFYCVFLQTKLPAVMKLANDSSTGSVQIKTYVRQILGRIYSGDDVHYIDGEWADLHSTQIIFDEQGAFRLNGNWTAKIWARDLEDDDVMLVKFILDDNNYIILTKWENMFSLSKYINGIKLYELHSHIQGDILSTDQLYFFIQNDVDLGLMNFDAKRVTDGRNTWYSSSYNNDVMPSYASENGFLTNLEDDFKNLFIDNIIDGNSQKVYIPTTDELLNADTTSKLGKAIIGKMVLNNTNEIILSASQKYFTRSIDSIDNNKLNIFNIDGTISSAYPNEKIGIRFIVKIPSVTKVTTFKDSTDSCYTLTIKVLNLFGIQNIGSLQVGDKIKAYAIKYHNELIRFTVLSKTDNTVSLLSDVINTSKEYDKEESVYVYGNTDWNLSNLKQWLNSNVKIG